MPWWIAVLNTLSALASTGFGVSALVKPGLIAPPSGKHTEIRFYPAMYAGRAIPLGLAVGVAVWLPPALSFLLLLLGVAVLAQIADAVIGAVSRLPGMIAGAAFAIICHGTAIATLL